MSKRDMTKNKGSSEPPRKPTLVEQIDVVLDRNFAAPWIDRDRLRRELVEVCTKANG
jgi:hypothetical protein